jgi:hypothetical protein
MENLSGVFEGGNQSKNIRCHVLLKFQHVAWGEGRAQISPFSLMGGWVPTVEENWLDLKKGCCGQYHWTMLGDS